MRKLKLKMPAILFVVLVMLSILSVGSVSAADYGCTVDTNSSAIYLENLDTGTIVFEKNISQKMYPASLTKIMTYIIVAENVPDFENTMVTIKQEAFDGLDPESSVMGLQSHVGESFSVLELLYGMMVSSGNDAAWVLADNVGNGVSNFVGMMNRKAGQLGCNGTHFVNPHGLYDPQHYTTASDMATIAKYALTKPHFEEISNTVTYTCRGLDEPLETTNYMLDSSHTEYYYPYAKGIKTGYTDEAGKCLITTADKDGYKYLCVALGSTYSYADEINHAMLDSKNLYTWAFDNIKFVELYSSNDSIKVLPVKFVWGDKRVNAVPKDGMKALLPANYDPQLVTTKIECKDIVSAPISSGEVFGKMEVYYNDELIGTTSLVSDEDIEIDKSNYYVHRFIGFVVEHIIIICIVFVLLVAVVILSISSRRRRKRAAKRRRYR